MITKKRNNYTLSPEAQAVIDAVKKNKSKFVSEAIVNNKPCEHEMVVCDEYGDVPLAGNFNGSAHAICHLCGHRPFITKKAPRC